MLTLSRLPGEAVVLELPGGAIVRVIVLPSDHARQALLGIEAPREISIWRSELLDKLEQEERDK